MSRRIVVVVAKARSGAAVLSLVYLPKRSPNLLDRDARVPSVRASAATVEALLARARREGWHDGRWFIEDYRQQAT
jgi:hypothetical protein